MMLALILISMSYVPYGGLTDIYSLLLLGVI
jgi:hypothetical protein